MELLEGETLSQLLYSGALPSVGERIRWIVEACEGLAEAHDAGLIHRDIKPANLMRVLRKGESHIKLLDFGVAKQLNSDSELTGGSAVGTLLYMAPEQIASSRTLDARADIWAMGVTLYRLLTGALPFEGEGENAVYMQSVLNRPMTPLSEYLKDADVGLDRVIRWALEKNPEKRPENIRQWAKALKPYAATTSESAERTPHTLDFLETNEGITPDAAAKQPTTQTVALVSLAAGFLVAVTVVALFVGRTERNAPKAKDPIRVVVVPPSEPAAHEATAHDGPTVEPSAVFVERPAPSWEDVRDGKAELRPGDRGPAVQQLQALLGAPKTGVYDVSTWDFVRAAQKRFDVPSAQGGTGSVDQRLVDHLVRAGASLEPTVLDPALPQPAPVRPKSTPAVPLTAPAKPAQKFLAPGREAPAKKPPAKKKSEPQNPERL
jgi:serine/threonine-protein kinase